jgi:uncharacterized protein (TIRG00374 family)
MRVRSIVQWVVGILLAGAGIWIFLRAIDLHKLADQLIHSDPLVIIICAVSAVLAIWLRALRSALLLPVCSPVQRKKLFPILMIAFMLNNILPARMGEAARAMLLWKTNSYSGAVSVGSIILERILDTLVFMSCFFIPVFFVPGLAGSSLSGSPVRALTMQTVALAFCAVFFFFFVLFVAYSRFPDTVKRWGLRLAGSKIVPMRFRTRINHMTLEIISNLEWTFSAKRVAGIVVLSYAIVSCYALMMYVIIQEKTFTFLHGLFSQAFAACGAAIPLAPGYVGTLHAVLLQGLILCGVERDKAAAATIFIHAVPYIAVTLLGLYYYFSFGVKFKDISNAKTEIDKSEKEGI